VKNEVSAPVKNIAPLFASDGKEWQYTSLAACQAGDMTQALLGFGVSTNMCVAVPNNNPAYGFHSWNSVCSGSEFVSSTYANNKCEGAVVEVLGSPYSTPATGCAYIAAAKVYVGSSCAAPAPGPAPGPATGSSMGSGDVSKTTAVGLGVGLGLTLVALIIMVILYKKAKEEAAVASTIRMNPVSELTTNSMFDNKRGPLSANAI